MEHEAEKQRKQLLNEIQPMVPVKQVWRSKQIKTTTGQTPSNGDDATIITSSTPLITSSSCEATSWLMKMLGDEEEMVDYESTLIREGMDTNS